jgi:hypothetical protein
MGGVWSDNTENFTDIAKTKHTEGVDIPSDEARDNPNTNSETHSSPEHAIYQKVSTQHH